MDGEVKERRKIQFSVPSAVPTQLDPKQVELIRRRRPTPATLFRLTDHPSPEEENPSHQLAICENGVLKPKRVHTDVYQPPSLKDVQKLVEAHMHKPDIGRDNPSSESSDNEEASTRDSPDKIGSDQSEHHSVSEVTDEDTVSIQLHDTPEEEVKEMAESKGSMTERTEDSDHEEDTGSGQSEHHSVLEVTDEDRHSAPQHDHPQQADKGMTGAQMGIDTRAEDSDRGESKEKREK